MPSIKYKNKSIHYLINKPKTKDKGNRGLVLIHGSGENLNVWNHQFNELEININLITIDLPSHGNSEYFNPEIISLELYVDVIKKLKNDLNLEGLILGGHSLGGAIAQSYYLSYPEDLLGLILISTGGRLRVSPRILKTIKTDFEQFLDTISIAAFHRNTPDDVINPYIEEISRVNPEIIHRDFEICDNFDILDKVGEINIPCLILVGKADKLTPVKYQRYFDQHIKHSKLTIIDAAGHSVMLEKPSKINGEIESFINKNF
ncbi:MAG: alpha/beta hydrolase [Promethearchaeota archaeon]|nr:MAG: alpha/beta hydrolase [Candidatus Lokiarchaeota archaeon]